jgi:hypothetical protein
MESAGEFVFGDSAMASYDQVQAQAGEALRRCDAFVLVCASWDENEDEIKLTSASGISAMDAVVFMALATAEVAKLLKTAVVAAANSQDQLDT